MTTFLKALPILYVIFAIAAVFVLLRNLGADDYLKNIGILFIGIVPLAIAVYPYFKTDKKASQINLILIYDTYTQTILEGPRGSEYFKTYGRMFTFLDKANGMHAASYDEVFGRKGLNIIEKGLLEAIMMKFYGGWDVSNDPREGFLVSSPGTPNVKTKNTSIKVDEIKALFSSNPYVANPNIFQTPSDFLLLPPKSKFVVSRNNDISTTIEIVNPVLPIKLHIMSSGANPATEGIWGLNDPDIGRYYIIDFFVTLSAQTQWGQRFPQDIEKYWNWYTNIDNVIKSFDWRTIEDKEIRRENKSHLWSN